jgi:hypothetical protein
LAGQEKQVEVACNSVWCSVNHIYDQGGVGVLAFIFLCFLFYKLIWKVWRSMITSKDQEIERLTDERNFYQSVLFPERQTSDCPPGKVDTADNARLKGPRSIRSTE